MVHVDDLDLKILKELKKDARQSYRKIASKLSVATGTIQNRIQKLENEGVIRNYHVCINYSKLGYNIAAIIAICIKRADLSKILSKLTAHPNVFGAFSVAGEYDFFISTRFKSMDKLNEFIVKELSDEVIEKSVTFLVLKTHKETHTFLIG